MNKLLICQGNLFKSRSHLKFELIEIEATLGLDSDFPGFWQSFPVPTTASLRGPTLVIVMVMLNVVICT